jgi:alkylation response protein AidB-like acyl-CoA dehydrogenase
MAVDVTPGRKPITSLEEVYETAQAYAAKVGETASERDLLRRFPTDEMNELRRSGLQALLIPTEAGGSGLTYGQSCRVIRTIAEGDSNIAQMTFIHTHAAELYNRMTAEDLQVEHNRRIVSGELWWTNAYSERTGKMIGDLKVTIERDGDEWVVNGTKFYCTGSLAGDEMYINAINPATNEVMLAFVPVDLPGVTIHDDWDAMGQRTTASGSTVFKDVRLPAERVVAAEVVAQLADPSNVFSGAYPQALFSSILVGIARNAMRDAKDYVSTKTRPWFQSGLDRAVDDPFIQREIGELSAKLAAVEALQDQGFDELDAAAANPSADARAAAAMTVYKAKILANEVALEVGEKLFQVCGASASLNKYNYHRHWRNARTLSLHDPAPYKGKLLGDYILNGTRPEVTIYT